MMSFYITCSLIVAVVSTCLILLIRRNLRQRGLAREFRAIFIAEANDLIGKPEFPDEHARHLIEFAAIPQGWITRYMVMVLIRGMFTGHSVKPRSNSLKLDQVPHNLRAKYVMAILALGLSDSYRCALLGRIWRGAYGWVPQAVKQVKPDVEAHATRLMVGQMFNVQADKQVRASVRRLECTA